MDIKEYKCPNCGGAVKFDSSSQKMKCPYCDTEFELAALEDYQKELQGDGKDNFAWDAENAGKTWDESELNDLTQGSCPSCGAELMGDANTLAMVCPCCGNSQIVARRLSGLLKPDYVIPFKLDKNAAVQELKKFYKGKRLLPNLFKDENRVNSIQGLYVPFWLFDAKAFGNMRFKATKTKVWNDSNYTYTKIDFYSVTRSGSLEFAKIPVDGSEKMDDAYMDAIEPFDYSTLTDFQSAFLSGYTAEKYDVDAEKSKERAGTRIKNSIENEFKKSVTGFSTVIQENSVVNIESGKINYALFPVWVLNTKYKKEIYQFMMNGQSGRLVGRLPADPGKSWKYRSLFTGIFGAAFTLIIQLLRIFMEVDFIQKYNIILTAAAWLVSFGIGFIIVLVWKRGMNTARMQVRADMYTVPGSLVYKEKKERLLYSKVNKVKRQSQSSTVGNIAQAASILKKLK